MSASVDRYNVVWKTPSKNSSGSMPLGNGDVGLNVWVEEAGDLLFYISKTDAWSENGRLLKLGRVRVKLSPNPFRVGLPFEQTLRLRQGEIEIRAGQEGLAVTLSVWVDANRPVIHVEAAGQQEFELQARLELWRKNDSVLPTRENRVAWCHRNETSNFASRLKAHHLAGLEKTYPDPLLHRTFGAVMLAKGMMGTPKRPNALASARPGKRFDIQIHVLCAQTPTSEEWLSRVEKSIKGVAALGLAATRTAHRAWWRDFWDRSWIRVTTSTEVGQDEGSGAIVPTTLPLRIGASSRAGDRFAGFIARARVFRRALRPAEIKKLSGGVEVTLAGDQALLGDWRLNRLDGDAFPNQAGPAHPARAVQGVEVAEFAGIKAAKLSGKGWIEIAHHKDLNVSKALTLDAWIAPEHFPGGGSRIIDKTPVGTADGYLLDTCPGNSLRLIVKAGTLTHRVNLPAKRWTHVAATFDAATGQEMLYVNGRAVSKRSAAALRQGSQGHIVSQGYALQRVISACGGRGAQPIKFNGSIFTFGHPEGKNRGGPDYRRWGPDYWLQNTRLMYWPMMAAGDFEMMQPLFRMYTDSMPLQKERTRRYFGHAGAYYPETMSFWGLSRDGDYGTGPGRKGKPVSWHRNQYIRREWQGGIEVLAMMLDYWAYTQESDFLKEDVLPFASEIIMFYDKHYKRDGRGKILFHPAQALETWWDCTNPMPEIAGLRFVLPKLLELPPRSAGGAQRKRWQRILGELPPVPMRKLKDGRPILSFADRYANRRNCENPELYAIFPYRLYGVGKARLEMARRSFASRTNKGCRGWNQDDTQMAYLGLAEQARGYVARRAASRFANARFPAIWGPNYDWIPDQTHGGNLMMALQTMLLQAEGRKILLFPAWPKGWDVDFRLHAPLRTTVEGVYRDGKLRQLTITPEERRRDVVILDPQ